MTVAPRVPGRGQRTVREDFNDGENYLKLHGQRMLVPELMEARPDREALRWHNENRYRG